MDILQDNKCNKYPTSSILLSRKKLKAFLLMTEAKQGYPPSLFLFNVVLEVLATTIRQMREIRIYEEEMKYPYLMMICLDT